MKHIYIIVGLLLLSTFAGAQEGESVPLPYRVVGLNTTPLLMQLIPFNRSNPKVVGPYYVTFRSYRQRKSGKVTGFRWALGADLSDVADEGVQSFVNFRIGAETRRQLHPKWAFSSGVDLMISLGDLNVPGTKETDAAAFGFGPVWGIEYGVSTHVSLSIETALFFGVESEAGFKFEFIPPVALYANFKIPRKEKKIKK